MEMQSRELRLFTDEPVTVEERKIRKRDDYAAFVEKFKPKKTTDDCYSQRT